MFFCAGLWMKARPQFSMNRSLAPPENALSIVTRDQEALKKNFKPEILKSKNWDEVNNYALSAKSLVQASNSSEWFKFSQSSAKDLAACLKKDFCKMERRNDNDSYFDETKTPAHILAGRNLEIMLASLKLNPGLKKNIDGELIRELTESQNEKIQVLALEIYQDFLSGETKVNQLLEIAENYQGNAKARALEKISSQTTPADRIQLLNALEKSFAIDDPNTVISIVEKMKKMNLSQDEIVKVSMNLCRFKDNGSDDPNWKMIKYDMKNLSNLEKICP